MNDPAPDLNIFHCFSFPAEKRQVDSETDLEREKRDCGGKTTFFSLASYRFYLRTASSVSIRNLTSLKDLHIISTLSPCYLRIISMLSLYYLHIISILSPYYLHIISMLSLYCLHIIPILSPCYLHIISMLSQYYLHIINVVSVPARVTLQFTGVNFDTACAAGPNFDTCKRDLYAALNALGRLYDDRINSLTLTGNLSTA